MYLTLHRSSSGGAYSEFIFGVITSGSQAYTACKAAPYRIDDAYNGYFGYEGPRGNFIAPFVLDPRNPTTILAGGQSLWRTTDARTALTASTGPTWRAIKDPSNAPISAIAIAQTDSDVVWVGHNNGGVFHTSNGTAASPTWTQVVSLSLPRRMVTRIAVDPQNPNTVYLTYGGFSANNVWKSTDGGASFAPAVGSGTTGLPAVPVHSLVVHPSKSDWIYVGTEVGIFASTDGGNTWSLPHDGPANVSVDELFWVDRTLHAATHGRGVYKTSAPIRISDPRMSIDGPRANAIVYQPFLTGGWAVDTGAIAARRAERASTSSTSGPGRS